MNDRQAGDEERLVERFLQIALPKAQFGQVVKTAADKAGDPGVVVIFQKDSVKVDIRAKGPLMIDHSGGSYDDHSIGPTGGKAFGPGAQAHSTGDIHQTLTDAKAAELADCLERLKSLVEALDLSDCGPLEEAQTSLDEVIDVARSPSPPLEKTKGLCQKAKACIDRAVYVGSIGVELAEKIRALYERIHSLLS